MFTIRDARPDEHEAITALTIAAYRQYATIMGPLAWEGLDRAVRAALATTDSVERIVAENDGEIVGSVLLFPAAVQAYDFIDARVAAPELRLLAVADGWRGKGIGEALVNECVRRARASGASELGLHTSR